MINQDLGYSTGWEDYIKGLGILDNPYQYDPKAEIEFNTNYRRWIDGYFDSMSNSRKNNDKN